MRILEGLEEKEARIFLESAAELAKYSRCLRAQSAALVVKEGDVIGQGWNSPPRDRKIGECLKDKLPKDFKSDRTCCVHAEKRAIHDALGKYGEDRIKGSRIYFVRTEQSKIVKAGDPYCTSCSKDVLEVGISEFVLWHERGITVYDAKEYNDLSFSYKED